MSDEIPNMAPGLVQAFATQEDAPREGGRRNSSADESISALRSWTPKTRLGREVMAGRIITYEQAMASGLPIREVEIVDALIPNLEDEIIKVNMVQRMTDSGRRVRFNVMACVGNKDGYVGLAMAKGKEVSQTIRKALTAAKLNIIQVQRGNGSWESSVGPGTSVPFKVQGQAGSTRVTLMPAPAGKGLVIGETGKKVLVLAGVTDVLSRTKGQTRTTINYAAATFNALSQVNSTRVSETQRSQLFIHKGRLLE
jgi:small subunit ribosomal protein S5|tara:strand:+ start:517 stop:1278 length:762 start_codon:yes stop_codon:yes gene_type:complete